MLEKNRPLICWWCKGELEPQALTSPWLSLSWCDCSENHSDARRGRRGTMLVYPKGSPSAMPFHRFQSKPLQRHFCCFCLIICPWRAIERHSPWTLVWWFKKKKNASSFRQFSMRREAKGKREFPISWSLNTFQLALKSAHQTLGHLQETIQRTPKARPSGCSRLEEQREKHDLAKMSFHPVIILHVLLLQMLEVDKS